MGYQIELIQIKMSNIKNLDSKFKHFFILIAVMISSILSISGCVTKNSSEDSTPKVAEWPIPLQDSSQPPQWREGDSWEYSDGYAVHITNIENGIATLERLDQKGLWVKRKGLFKIESQDPSAYRRLVFRAGDQADLFPLAMGKHIAFTREFLADGQLRVHRTTWSVDGSETIEVPAGKFDCWILTMHTQSLNSDWQGYERWWYHPDIKHYVRLEYKYGNTPPASRVLMRYKLS